MEFYSRRQAPLPTLQYVPFNVLLKHVKVPAAPGACDCRWISFPSFCLCEFSNTFTKTGVLYLCNLFTLCVCVFVCGVLGLNPRALHLGGKHSQSYTHLPLPAACASLKKFFVCAVLFLQFGL